MTYIIEGHCYLTNESYREKYESKADMINGLKSWFKRDDINVTEEEFHQVLEEGYFADGYDIIRLEQEHQESTYETDLLQSKIRLMNEYQNEGEFYRIQGLFNQAINVEIIVQTFREVYDSEFQFIGSPYQLYEAINQWIDENIND